MRTTSNLFIEDIETGKPVPVKLLVADEHILIVFPSGDGEVASVMVESVDGELRLLYWPQAEDYDTEEPTIVVLNPRGGLNGK